MEAEIILNRNLVAQGFHLLLQKTGSFTFLAADFRMGVEVAVKRLYTLGYSFYFSKIHICSYWTRPS